MAPETSSTPAPASAASAEQQRVDDIVLQGPGGAFAVAGVATALVVAMWFGFYFFIYLPRGAVQ
jgi:hypothetical protein